MYLRISTASADVPLNDLGYTVVHPAENEVISDQFDVDDLTASADLTAAIQSAALTAQVLLDGTWTSVAAGDWDPKDVLGAHNNAYEIFNTVDNQRLVNGADCSEATELHHHDSTYYTETEIGGNGGAALVGVDDADWDHITGADAQEALDSVDDLFDTLVTLDTAYTNDSDGIMEVNGTSKDLNLRSDNVNDIKISRTNGTDLQDILATDVASDELVLGSAAVGGLDAVDVRVKTNLIIEGNITYTGTITDTTVNELNVTNANIILREGATTGADASVQVERGSTGDDATLRWDETDDRWKAGLEGDDNTIALLELNEVVTGVWEMQGGGVTEPSMYLTEKAAAPTTELGAAGQIPMSMMPEGILAVYDKSNSRNKWLSVAREYMIFSGRNHQNNSNEYMRFGDIPSNLSSNKLIRDKTLLGISVDTAGAETWTLRVRKNGAAADLASLVITAADGGITKTLNVDFAEGDIIQVYIDGSGVNRPTAKLEFADRF